MRVGEVTEAKPHPNADKLLVLNVNIGEKKSRQIVAGIAKHYSPEALVGKKLIVVVNLEPAKLRGETSQGMLLAASNKKTLEVLSVDNLNPGDTVS